MTISLRGCACMVAKKNLHRYEGAHVHRYMCGLFTNGSLFLKLLHCEKFAVPGCM